MRVLPTHVHGVIDYVWGLALMAAPFLFGFANGGAAQWIAMVLGAVAILYSLLTDYELGVARVVPMPMHLGLDFAGGAFLMLSPWLFGFAREVFWPHLLFGLFSVIASLITRTVPTESRSIGSAAHGV